MNQMLFKRQEDFLAPRTEEPHRLPKRIRPRVRKLLCRLVLQIIAQERTREEGKTNE